MRGFQKTRKLGNKFEQNGRVLKGYTSVKKSRSLNQVWIWNSNCSRQTLVSCQEGVHRRNSSDHCGLMRHYFSTDFSSNRILLSIIIIIDKYNNSFFVIIILHRYSVPVFTAVSRPTPTYYHSALFARLGITIYISFFSVGLLLLLVKY